MIRDFGDMVVGGGIFGGVGLIVQVLNYLMILIYCFKVKNI